MGPLSIEEVLAEEAAVIHDLTDPTTKEIVDKLRKLASSEDIEDARADKDADERSGADEPRDWVKNRKAFYCAAQQAQPRRALLFRRRHPQRHLLPRRHPSAGETQAERGFSPSSVGNQQDAKT